MAWQPLRRSVRKKLVRKSLPPALAPRATRPRQPLLPGIGVDTDASGGLVVLSPRAESVIATFTAPTKSGRWHHGDAAALVEALREAIAPHGQAHVFIEEDQPIRGDGGEVKTRMHATRMLARMVGRYEVLLAPLAASCALVAVSEWQPAQLGRHRILSADTKSASIAAARSLWPGIDLTPGRRREPQHGVSDAALIARHGLRRLLLGL